MDAKLLEKMRKVMALAKEGVEGEAAAAAAILQKMLLEHNLSIADLEKKGAAKQGVSEAGHDLGKTAFRWKLDLAEAIAEHYWCVPLVDYARKTVAFVGRPDNVESLTMLYAWLMQQIKLVATEERAKYQETNGHVDPLRWQVNFGVGAVQRLEVRLKEEKKKHAEEVARNDMGDVVGLACVRDTENSDYLEKTRGYRVDGKETANQKRWREEREAKEREAAAWREAHPEEAKAADERRRLESEAYWKKENARQRRNERARANRVHFTWRSPRRRTEAEMRAEEQADDAKRSGHSAADRINLKPFLTGEAPPPAPKLGKGKKS